MNNIFLEIFILILAIEFSDETIDINFAEYQYLADRLTEEECHRLIAALHFHEFELSKAVHLAERRLPKDVPCIDLLFHWNSADREGKGKTHVQVCHRLNQIGRPDLAQWLSKTVFHKLSQDVGNSLNSTLYNDKPCECLRKCETYEDDDIIVDEAAWWKLDSIFSVFLVLGILVLIGGTIFFFALCTLRQIMNCRKGYRRVPNIENSLDH